MSMFMVSKAHVDVITTLLLRSELVPGIAGLTGDQVGLSLWLENWNSGKSRYPSAWGENPDSTENLDVVTAYRYQPMPLPDAPGSRLVRAAYSVVLDCYHYQASEHPTWERSPAYAWTTELRRALDAVEDIDAHRFGLWPIYSAEKWAETVAKLEAGA